MEQKLKVKQEFLPTRCEICHQWDQYNPWTNFCMRCVQAGCMQLQPSSKKSAKPANAMLPSKLSDYELGRCFALIWSRLCRRQDIPSPHWLAYQASEMTEAMVQEEMDSVRTVYRRWLRVTWASWIISSLVLLIVLLIDIHPKLSMLIYGCSMYILGHIAGKKLRGLADLIRSYEKLLAAEASQSFPVDRFKAYLRSLNDGF